MRVLETPGAQAAAMAAGTRRLLLLGVPSPIRGVQAGLDQRAAPGARRRAARGVGAVLADATTAALDALIAEAGGPAWDPAAFARLRGHVAGRLQAEDGRGRGPGGARSWTPRATSSAASRRSVGAGLRRRPPRRRAHSWPGSCPRASSPRTGAARLPDVERYLRARPAGSSGCPTRSPSTATACARVRELEHAYRSGCEAWPRGRAGPRRAARGALDARGAAGQPVRTGPRHPRAGVGEADPPRAGVCVAGRCAADVNGGG